MAKTVSVDEMASEIMNILQEYKAGVDVITEDSVRDATNAARACVRELSPSQNGKKTYKRNWRTKFINDGQTHIGIVYQGKWPGLTHLLEYGHAKVGDKGGRTEAQAHIAPAQEEAGDELMRKLKEGLT